MQWLKQILKHIQDDFDMIKTSLCYHNIDAMETRNVKYWYTSWSMKYTNTLRVSMASILWYQQRKR